MVWAVCREKWTDLAEKVEMGLTWIDHDTIEQPVEEVEVGKDTRGLHKRCRLSLLTNSAPVYKPKCGGRGGGVAGSQPYAGAQINFGDLTPYLTYVKDQHCRIRERAELLIFSFKP
jgi:hypothetical protein